MEISYFSDDHGLRNGFPSANNMKRKNAQCGFSLIELIVVIAIMSVLIGLVAPMYMKYVARQRMESCERNREAILRVYERALYDNSIDDVQFNETDLQKVVDAAYPATNGEVNRYRECRNHTANDGKKCDYHAALNETDGTAYIECADCMDKEGYKIISIDLLGWKGQKGEPSTDAEREEPTSSSEEPIPDPEKWTIDFNNGTGETPPFVTLPGSKEVEDGKKVDNPGAPKLDSVYDLVWGFAGWYESADCSGTSYNFNTAVHSSFTLYAKWNRKKGDSVWPYPDEDAWWTVAGIQKQIAAGRAGSYKFSDDQYIDLIGPTGVFQSKDTGALFCIVRQNSNGTRIYKSMASSPEYYSAIQGTLNQSLVHLTGTRETIDISGYRSNDYIPAYSYTYGDLIEFVDNGRSYLYVYWHVNDGNAESFNYKKSDITGYPYKLNNLYRVNP